MSFKDNIIKAKEQIEMFLTKAVLNEATGRDIRLPIGKLSLIATSAKSIGLISWLIDAVTLVPSGRAVPPVNAKPRCRH